MLLKHPDPGSARTSRMLRVRGVRRNRAIHNDGAMAAFICWLYPRETTGLFWRFILPRDEHLRLCMRSGQLLRMRPLSEHQGLCEKRPARCVRAGLRAHALHNPREQGCAVRPRGAISGPVPAQPARNDARGNAMAEKNGTLVQPGVAARRPVSDQSADRAKSMIDSRVARGSTP